jgi:glycosyltransferase involved in cell wall biosynthesis
MKLAFVGQKGIPAIWGGIETHVEELGRRLVERGHNVTVYVRNWYTPIDRVEYKGIKLKHIPCIHTKYFDAITHTFNSSINSLFNSYDIIHYQSIGPALLSWIPRLFRKKVVATIHRFDYESGKWGYLAKGALKISEKFALSIPNQTIVVAEYQQKVYSDRGYNPIYIPNGVNIIKPRRVNIIKRDYNLKGKDYILYMGRLVPEKRCSWLIEAFNKVYDNPNNNLKLVIAGGSSSSDDYVKELKVLSKNNSKIIFTDYVTGIRKEELFSNALLFILPSYLEGLPIAVLEAFSYGLPCLVSDIISHKEVINENVNGFFFSSNDYYSLEKKLKEILTYSGEDLEKVGKKAREYVKKMYSWDSVVDKTERVYFEVLNRIRKH